MGIPPDFFSIVSAPGTVVKPGRCTVYRTHFVIYFYKIKLGGVSMIVRIIRQLFRFRHLLPEDLPVDAEFEVLE